MLGVVAGSEGLKGEADNVAYEHKMWHGKRYGKRHERDKGKVEKVAGPEREPSGRVVEVI